MKRCGRGRGDLNKSEKNSIFVLSKKLGNMIIDFNQMELCAIPNFKGGEGVAKMRMTFDGRNKVMIGTLEPGCTIGCHRHDTSSEVIYILSGDGRCLYDGGEELLRQGMAHYCPQGHSHSLMNASETEPLNYFAVVSEQ